MIKTSFPIKQESLDIQYLKDLFIESRKRLIFK